jgi:hypothetical protein
MTPSDDLGRVDDYGCHVVEDISLARPHPFESGLGQPAMAERPIEMTVEGRDGLLGREGILDDRAGNAVEVVSQTVDAGQVLV